MNCIIVDDDKLSCKLIEGFVKKSTSVAQAVMKDVLTVPIIMVEGPRKLTEEVKTAPAIEGLLIILLVAICCVDKLIPLIAPATSKGTVGLAI